MANQDFYMVYSNKANDEKKDLSESVIILLVYPKNSETYNQALSVLVGKKVSELDYKSKEILRNFDHDHSLNNECLTEKKLKSLPNLFLGSIESADYGNYLNVMMYEISKSQLLTPSILEYLTSYLDNVNLNDDSCVNNHRIFSILYMLLHFYYGENGCNLLKGHESKSEDICKAIMEIEKYLSDFDSSFQEKIDPTFLKSLDFLKKLLHHKIYSILNFKARDICHYFGIKLDLSLLISLCIDGVKLDNEVIENLVMFIGNIGSGKSTTINYLYGIDYKIMCSKKTQKYFLKQLDENVIAPVKVGHGNLTETLFPKIVKNGNLLFCELPGFNDTRNQACKTCPSLASQVACHFAKNQQIVAIVVIDWDTIMLYRANQLFEIIKTVQSLIKDLSNKSLKFLYAITKPPLPPDEKYLEEDDLEENKYFDSNEMAKDLFCHLSFYIKKLRDEYEELKKNIDVEMEQLNKKALNLKTCKKAFDKLRIDLSKSQKMQDLKLGNEASNRELYNWVNDRVEKLIDKILKELESKPEPDQKEKVVDDIKKTETQKLDEEIEECQKDIERINNMLHEKTSLLDFLKKIKADDIYIIRGFKLNNQWKDHREKLLKRIEEIFIQNNDQKDKDQFSVVLDCFKNDEQNKTNDPKKVYTLNNIGVEYEKLENYDETLEYFEVLLHIYDKKLLISYPNLAAILNNIGNLYLYKGTFDKALYNYQKSLDIKIKYLNSNDPEIAITYNNIGIVYERQGKLNEALRSFEESLKIITQTLPENHPNVAKTLSRIGNIYHKQGNYFEATDYYKRSLDIYKLSLATNDPKIISLLNIIAHLIDDQGKYDEALKYYQELLEIKKQALPANHPDIKEIYSCIGVIYMKQGKENEAFEIYNNLYL